MGNDINFVCLRHRQNVKMSACLQSLVVASQEGHDESLVGFVAQQRHKLIGTHETAGLVVGREGLWRWPLGGRGCSDTGHVVTEPRPEGRAEQEE